MDYLDPRKRRVFRIRLIVGYILVAIVIGLGTVIIVYGANGYGINTKTGQIVQNGLLFADSNPAGADIYLNGQNQHARTSARLVLPANNYALTIQKNGYRSWSRQFTLNEQSVARFVYPLLFPTKLVSNNLKSYSQVPGLITQSLDRRWLLVESQSDLSVPTFDEFDTTSLDQDKPITRSVAMPAGLLSGYSVDSKLSVVEWASDNNKILLQHLGPSVNEFIVFDRSHPDQSFNINRIFNISPTAVSFRDKKADQLYIYNQVDGTLRVGDVSSTELLDPILRQVLAYKPYAKNLIIFVTNSGEPAGKVVAKIWDNGQLYKLNEFNSGEKYLIDMAQFQGHYYYASGSSGTDRINIYKDPLDGLKNPGVAKALPALALHISGSQKLSFSTNARFIGVENGQMMAVFDIETQSSYLYTVQDPLSDDLHWMDGHRYVGLSGGKIIVMDYDGSNKQLLSESANSDGGFFSRDYKHLLTIANDSSTTLLQDNDLRAGNDLPKNKQN